MTVVVVNADWSQGLEDIPTGCIANRRFSKPVRVPLKVSAAPDLSGPLPIDRIDFTERGSLFNGTPVYCVDIDVQLIRIDWQSTVEQEERTRDEAAGKLRKFSVDRGMRVIDERTREIEPAPKGQNLTPLTAIEQLVLVAK